MTTRRVLVSGNVLEACAGYKSRRLSIASADAENQAPVRELEASPPQMLPDERAPLDTSARTWLHRLPFALALVMGYFLINDRISASTRYVATYDMPLDASALAQHSPVPVTEEQAEFTALAAVAGEVQSMKDSIKLLQDQIRSTNRNVAQKAELAKIHGVMEQLEKRIQSIAHHVNEEHDPKLQALALELRQRQEELETMNEDQEVNVANRALRATLWPQRTTWTPQSQGFSTIIPALQFVGLFIPRYTEKAQEAERKAAWRSLDTVIDEHPIRGYMDAGCVMNANVMEVGVIFPYPATVRSIALEHVREPLDRTPGSRPIELEVELFEKTHKVHQATYKQLTYNELGVWQVDIGDQDDIVADRIAVKATSTGTPVCIYRLRVFGR